LTTLAKTFLEFTGPILLSKMIKHIESESDINKGILLVSVFILSRISLIILNTYSTFLKAKKILFLPF